VSGDSKTFNKAFQQMVKRTNSQYPERSFDPWTEMRAQAHLAVFHIHPETKSLLQDEEQILDITAARLVEFKEYIEKNGALFANNEQFLPYIGLPYILSVDTEQNEGLNAIYQKRWVDEIEQDMERQVEIFCSLL